MRYPVSFGQQRLWFIDQLEPGEATYLMPFATWLTGPVDPEALERAWAALVVRHGVLRTSIVTVDGLPEQVVDPDATVTVERLSVASAPDPVAAAEEIAKQRACRPFALDQGPLVRASLVAVGPDRWLFVLVQHHIISDGLSMAILFRELSTLYRVEVAGDPADLAPLWMDYGDFAVWQTERLRGEELERQLGYWRQQLRGAPARLDLPTTFPRPTRQSSRGAVVSIDLGPGTTAALTELAARSGVTLFMTFLTGLVATLARYCRQDDIVVGTPVGGRTHVELEPVLGMFTNTVALRTSVAGDPSFVELLGQVRDTTLDAMAHQELPFGKLVEDLAPERTLAHAPLVQVQFAHQSLSPPTLDLPDVTSRCWAVLTDTAKLDLTIYADASAGDSTALVLEYSTDLFDEDWAQRFLGCLANVLDHAARAPQTRVGDLALLPGSEQTALLAAHGVGPTPDLPEIDVRAQLAASPATVVDGAGELSMVDVCDRAARLARALAGHGVGPESLVGLCVGRGIDMLVGLLGVWWAGAAYVPLDPGFPLARLAAMAEGAGLRLVLTDTDHLAVATAAAPDAVRLRVDDPALAGVAPLEPVTRPAHALAYVIFTSGSTGQPKGVAVEHRAVTNLLHAFARRFDLGRADRFAAVTTLSFDIALLELLLPPFVGADLVIATAEQTREPDQLRSLLDRTGATAMQATPQTWRLLLAAGGVPDGLRLRLCGGEALPRDLANQLAAPGATVWNLYGPTETTVWSAAGVVEPGSGPVGIGPPIDHTRVYIVDERLVPVPVGVVGEVYLAGRGVARGYHDRPRLSARSWRPDPFSGEPGARMYRTGDLGRWLPGGGLELIGRTDHQVKLRGFRIECGEIETVLRGHRDVRQAAVVMADRGGEAVLVGYVVPRRGSPIAAPGADPLDLLRPHLTATLPEYMIPSALVVLPALPLTPNAKVDRSALPAPVWGERPAADRVEPRTPVEETLARIWADLLAEPAPVGVTDNLFATGGHSLTATRFVARVADTYGVQLPVHQVFASPTIADLAAIVAADPDVGEADRHALLDQLSDEDLDALLQAALAQRARRRGVAAPPNPTDH